MTRRDGGRLVLAFGLVLGLANQALAQGQESVAAPMAPQTQPRPVPLLSSIAATSVPSATPIDTTPLAGPDRRDAASGLALPGPIGVAVPQKLACAEIGEAVARQRCESRPGPAAPPMGAAQ